MSGDGCTWDAAGPDLERAARLRDVLAGGRRGTEADRQAAAHARAAWPSFAALPARVFAWHRTAAAWAVTETRVCPPARAVVFTSAGLPPPDGPLHASAARLAPAARFAYVCRSARAELLNRALLEPGGGRVTVLRQEQAAPESWLDTPAGQQLLAAGPVSVHLVMALQYWPEEVTARVLGACRERLPAGSSMCLTTLWIPAAPDLMAFLAEHAAPLRSLSPGEVAGRLAAAGLRLHPRGAGAFPEVPQAARVVTAVAVVP